MSLERSTVVAQFTARLPGPSDAALDWLAQAAEQHGFAVGTPNDLGPRVVRVGSGRRAVDDLGVEPGLPADSSVPVQVIVGPG